MTDQAILDVYSRFFRRTVVDIVSEDHTKTIVRFDDGTEGECSKVAAI